MKDFTLCLSSSLPPYLIQDGHLQCSQPGAAKESITAGKMQHVSDFKIEPLVPFHPFVISWRCLLTQKLPSAFGLVLLLPQTLVNPLILSFPFCFQFFTLSCLSLSFSLLPLHRSLMEQLRRLQALVMNTSNKPAQTGTCVLVRTSSVCQTDKQTQTLQMIHR